MVSIHAPTRGATNRTYDATTDDQFQSTPPRGERRIAHTTLRPTTSFNPRSRAGSDITPAMGLSLRRCFNPRSRAGSDR